MNDKNFDSLKNLKAPESWIENAINIPDTEEKPKPVFFLRYSRSLAAVACLVIVCAISLVIALNQDENVLPIEPSIETVTTDTTVNDETKNNTDIKKPTFSEVDETTQSSNGENGGAPFEGTIDNNASTNKPTIPSQAPDSDPTSSSGDTNIEPTEVPVIKPTILPTVKPTGPPIVEPTVRPTDDPQFPGSPGDPYEPPTDTPCFPTDSEGEGPTEPSTPSGSIPSDADCSGITNIKNLTGQGRVYCIVTDPSGNQMGSKEWFIEEHRATVYQQIGTTVYFAYSVRGHYTIYESGTYTCNFYNEDGEKLFTNLIYIIK